MMIKGEEGSASEQPGNKEDRESEGWTPSPTRVQTDTDTAQEMAKIINTSKQERISLNEKQPLNIGYKMTW